MSIFAELENLGNFSRPFFRYNRRMLENFSNT